MRPLGLNQIGYLSLFQSTHPSWGATHLAKLNSNAFKYFNPRTHRGVRRPGMKYRVKTHNISIHAPIVGCDHIPRIAFMHYLDFNPRTHRGVRLLVLRYGRRLPIFQSTHPSWGATKNPKKKTIMTAFQSTHPSWGATPLVIFFFLLIIYFNPRTHRGMRQ